MRDPLTLWRLLYPDSGGYLAVFSGRRLQEEPCPGEKLRPNGKPGKRNRLTDPRTRYFRYPEEAPAASGKPSIPPGPGGRLCSARTSSRTAGG